MWKVFAPMFTRRKYIQVTAIKVATASDDRSLVQTYTVVQVLNIIHDSGNSGSYTELSDLGIDSLNR